MMYRTHDGRGPGANTPLSLLSGIPFTITSAIDGKKAKRECMPAYFPVPLPCSRRIGCAKKGAQKTAGFAKDIESSGGGAPSVDDMER